MIIAFAAWSLKLLGDIPEKDEELLRGAIEGDRDLDPEFMARLMTVARFKLTGDTTPRELAIRLVLLREARQAAARRSVRRDDPVLAFPLGTV